MSHALFERLPLETRQDPECAAQQMADDTKQPAAIVAWDDGSTDGAAWVILSASLFRANDPEPALWVQPRAQGDTQ